MSNAPFDFMSLVMQGYALPDEIDDFVDIWHEGDSEIPLHEFLGMTEQEYSLWIKDASFLNEIIAARHHGKSLDDAVNDNLRVRTRIAARTDEAWKIKILRDWIESQRSH